MSVIGEAKNEEILPDISKGNRIIPNDMIRSSLFNVSNKNRKRELLKNTTIYSFHSSEITYTGEELRQDDEDVWLQLVFLASQRKCTEINFKPYSFLKEIGWPARTQYRDKLKETLIRLSATDLKIQSKCYHEGIDLSLVRKFTWNDTTGSSNEWKVWLEPEIVKLFTALGRTYTKVHWEQRKKLKPLAKWLHSFYSSHNIPDPIHLNKLMKLTGSKTRQTKHFKETLSGSLIELCQVGFLSDYFIDAMNYVIVSRNNKQRNDAIYSEQFK